MHVGAGNSTANDQIAVTLKSGLVTALGINASNLGNTTASLAAITALDTAIDTNNTNRASYGASQNSLTSALHALESSTENLVAAESRIRDVDFASEPADMTRNNIFQQAGVAVLAQPNSAPQVALQLMS